MKFNQQLHANEEEELCHSIEHFGVFRDSASPRARKRTCYLNMLKNTAQGLYVVFRFLLKFTPQSLMLNLRTLYRFKSYISVPTIHTRLVAQLV